ncbi:unnamed protein product [Caenorhabditis auriculariae]|uniref:CCAAT-binding factor domain-containing protein n=1 Tax=Caenorhabditis auriculariae TaxID=2777116 RepID=A0A8S1HMI8_9PELO|nr:unnamed protein product [Caenorhabditis auriculariae]
MKVKKVKTTTKLQQKSKSAKDLKVAEALKNVQKVQNGKSIEQEPVKNGKKKEKKQNEEIEEPQNGTKKRQLKKILKQDGLLVKHSEGEQWFSYQVDKKLEEDKKQLPGTEVEAFLRAGREALKQDSLLFQQRERSDGGSEASWFYSVIAKGTAADRRTAMQLQMHKSPVHSLEYVEKLLSGMKKPGTRDIIDTIPILEDVFLNHFLPPQRKLLTFSNRPLADLTQLSSGNDRSRRKILLLWAFENDVKTMYQQFLQSLAEIISRPLEDVSKRAVRAVANCLIERPEAENVALSILVNAFGHPNYKIGANLVHIFEDVARRHPAMRPVIVAEIERLIFQVEKNVNERAHLYSVTFLSQMQFSTEDGELACRVMAIYLALFKTLVNQKITDNRLLPILLAGANRAFPFAKGVESLIDDVQGIYKFAHSPNIRTSILALRLLFQFHKLNDFVSDRYYGALYRKLLDQCSPSAYAQLIKLLFDTLKEDPSAMRVRTFVKRLLQTAVNETAEFAASILITISKLKGLRPTETLVVLQKDVDKAALNAAAAEDDDEEERYFDVDDEGNEVKVVKEEVKEEKPLNEDDKKKVKAGSLGPSSKGGWVHRTISGKRDAKSPYDPDARNPLYIDSSTVADAELLLLAKHYHPSVAVFAQALLEGREINYNGDALNDFSLMSFLDRFAFRNPKIEKKKEGAARVVRKKAHDPWGVRKLAVDSKEYTSKKRGEIPADERFLHHYASTVLRINDKKKPKKEPGAEDDDWEIESVNSEEFDAIMDRFEPGGANDEFDIDYSKEFSAEKKKRGEKRKAEEDVEMDDDDEEDFDEDDDDDEGDDGEDEDLEDDEEDDVDSDEDDGDDENSKNVFGKAIAGDDSSDEDIGENDYEMAGDEFAAMLEDAEEEEQNSRKGKKSKKSKIRKPKGFKKTKRR